MRRAVSPLFELSDRATRAEPSPAQGDRHWLVL